MTESKNTNGNYSISSINNMKISMDSEVIKYVTEFLKKPLSKKIIDDIELKGYDSNKGPWFIFPSVSYPLQLQMQFVKSSCSKEPPAILLKTWNAKLKQYESNSKIILPIVDYNCLPSDKDSQTMSFLVAQMVQNNFPISTYGYALQWILENEKI